MYLGIEIGGTKLQLGVGSPQGGALVQLRRMSVDREEEAEGILSQIQIQSATEELLQQHPLTGIGFGGPVDFCGGLAVKSHHVAGRTRATYQNMGSCFLNKTAVTAIIVTASLCNLH